MAFNRELSQFASYLDLDAAGKYIGITPAESETNVGIGVTNPSSKLSVVGDANITGVVTATQFYGDLDYSYILNATAGVRTEISVVDNGGDGSLSYDGQTGIISYVGPSASEARAHFSATSSDFGSLSYSAETGVIAYTGVTTANIRDQFSSSSADIGSLSYDSATGEFSLAGVTTSAIRDQFSASSADIGSLSYDSQTGEIALSGVTTSAIRGQFSASSADIGSLSYDSETGEFALAGVTTSTIRDQFSGGTGVTITDGSVAIGQPVGTTDSVTFASVNSTGIVTATEFVTGASGEAIGINTNTISGPATLILDPAGVGDNTGLVVIKGDLQIDGETTTINSVTVTIEDKNIQIADGAINDAAADGAGITVNSGDGNKTFQFSDANNSFQANIGLDVTSGNVYKIDGTEVLSSTTLGSGVTASSLTSVGTLTNLSVGDVNSTGIVTATGFSGDLTGNVTGDLTGNVTGDLTGVASTATSLETARDFSVSGDVATAAAVSFDGTGDVDLVVTLSNNFSANTSGIITASSFVGDLTGNADTATALETARDFSISGDAEATAISFDGTANVGLALTLADTTVTAGSYGSSSEIPTFTVDSKGRLTAAGIATVSTDLNVSGDSGSEVISLISETLTISGGTNLTSSAANNTVTVNLDDNISLTSVVASGVVTATSGFSGNLTGNVTGDLTGEVNAAAFDTNADGIVVTGVATATSGFSGNLTGNVTGNADTASGLSTARTIALTGDVVGEVIFDGTSNVSIAATIQPDSVALGGDTTGDYVESIADSGSSDITVSGSGESAAVTLGLTTTGVVAGSYGSGSEIPTFSVDSRGRLTAAGTVSVSTGMTVAGDSGSDNINLLTDTLTIAGGTNLTSSVANDTVTVNLDDNISLTSVVASGIVTAAQFVTGASGQAIGINTDTISGPSTLILDPAGVGDNTGLVVIKGDLQIDGTTTTVNSTELVVDDKNITLASGAINDAAADGGGITIESGDGNKTWNWVDATDSWTSSEHIDAVSGKVYKIGGTEVLSSDTLGSGVVNSSLTSVGTLGQLNVSGVTTSSGGFVGDLTGNADTATALETGRDFSISGDAEASAITFDGTSNVGLALTLATTGVTAGSYGSSTEIPTFTVDAKGRLTAAGIATVSTDLTVAGDSGSETISLLTDTLTISGGTNLTSSASSDTVTVNLDDNISLTSVVASGIVTAAGFAGDLTGNVTGDLNSSGVSTVTNLVIGGYVSAGSTTGQQDQVLVSVGAGVSWITITDLLPTARTGLTTSASASQTTFSFEYNVGFLDVFVNGVKLSASEFTALNGNDIILGEPAFGGDTVEFVSYATLASGTGEVNSLNDLTDVSLTAPTAGSLLVYNGINWIDSTELNGITALDATTTATIEAAVAAAPNDFTSLNISGISTFTGAVDANGGADISGGLTVDSVNASGIITATSFYGNGSNLTGTGSTVSDDATTDATFYPVFTSITSGTITASNVSTTKLTFNPSTGTLAATNVNTTSDINLKKDISPVENALETVQKLEGVHFTWKDNDKQTIGVIAQQIEEHLPQLVDTAEHKSVNYNGLIGVLIEAVKEQQSQIEVLKAEIEELKK
jgi:hypothetical protein